MRNFTLLLASASAFLAGTSHADAPPVGGTISVRLAAAGAGGGASPQIFPEAVAEALAARGFTILDDPDHAASVAEVTVTREQVGTGKARAPTGRTTVLPGVAPGAGAGVVIPFSAGRSSLVALQRTVLDLRIRRRGEEGVAWHGAAVTVRSAGARDGTDKSVAASLSEAVLRAYPAEPADVVGVP